MIKKLFLLIICSLLSNFLFSQKKSLAKYALSQKISSDYELVFLKYNKDYNLYSNPRILHKGKLKLVSAFDENNYSGAKIKISKNKKYFVLDNIIKGYVYVQNDSILHENYNCIIIDVKNSKIVYRMQTDCGGFWNKKNQWVHNNEILF
ncbi:hypothetical protein [Flavobacterium flavigenum]|uniref:hypothetical protein n=1 Tax=Flavobacterium flavigenum TaxID=3003258 RepID=UPI0022AC26A6|nr:hypothetical protein [Flavobacterium flavigenum]